MPRGNDRNLGRRDFARLLERAGLPRGLRIHDLRHTAATILLPEGLPVKVGKVVSEALGHADVATTVHASAHTVPGIQQAAPDTTGRLFAKQR